jgi:carbohydrate-binding DOMON domain-containing protein
METEKVVTDKNEEILKKIIVKMKEIKIETEDLERMKEVFREIQALRTYVSYQYALASNKEFKSKLNVLLKNLSYMFDTQSRILTIIEIENNFKRRMP